MRLVRRHHLTLPAALYAVITLLLGIGAINSQNNLLFWAFGVAISGLILSGIVSGSALMGVRVRRMPIPTGQVGQPMRIRYELTTVNRVMPAFAITVRELPRGGAGPAATPNWRSRGEITPAFAPHVPRRRRTIATATYTPSQRGRVTFGPLRAQSSFPLGAMLKSVSALPEKGTLPDSAIVWPRIVDLPPGALRRSAAKRSEGQRVSSHRGRGDEFYGVREYEPGDAPRSVSWRLSARHDVLMVREDAAYDALRSVVVLTLSTKHDDDRDARNEAAISVAASALTREQRRGAAVGLWVPQRDLRITPASGRAHLHKLLDALALIDTDALDEAQRIDPARLHGVIRVDAEHPSVLAIARGEAEHSERTPRRDAEPPLVGAAS